MLVGSFGKHTEMALGMQVIDWGLKPGKNKEEKDELGRLNLRPPCRSDKALVNLTGCSRANSAHQGSFALGTNAQSLVPFSCPVINWALPQKRVASAQKLG